MIVMQNIFFKKQTIKSKAPDVSILNKVEQQHRPLENKTHKNSFPEIQFVCYTGCCALPNRMVSKGNDQTKLQKTFEFQTRPVISVHRNTQLTSLLKPFSHKGFLNGFVLEPSLQIP